MSFRYLAWHANLAVQSCELDAHLLPFVPCNKQHADQCKHECKHECEHECKHEFAHAVTVILTHVCKSVQSFHHVNQLHCLFSSLDMLSTHSLRPLACSSPNHASYSPYQASYSCYSLHIHSLTHILTHSIPP